MTLVNKLFIANMSLAKRILIFVKEYENKNKFIQIKSKKERHNNCDHTHFYTE